MRKLLLATFVLVTLIDAGCKKPTTKVEASTEPAPSASASSSAPAPLKGSTSASDEPWSDLSKSVMVIQNATETDTNVYVAFGADSVVLPSAWSFCTATSKLNCNFPLAAGAAQTTLLGGKYLNATVGFGGAIMCGTTKAELNLNNPKWYDIADVSLVDGFSNKIEIEVKGRDGLKKLGPPLGKTGNEAVFGLFPLGCDICTARQSPPCGMKPGKDGCKAGTQYKPDVPCQYQGPVMGGGSAYKVILTK